MRGKTALPLIRSGDEFSRSGVPDGRAPEVCPGLGVTPGGSEGGSTNGEPAPVFPGVWVASAATGTAVAAVEPGHGLVRNEPRASEVRPFRQRATTRNRYAVAGSSPASVVRDVSADRVTVVGDQMP